MRVAIIGGGPRGLWAAERLLALAAATGARVDVDVWDDRPLGEGSGYRRDQPQSWRLNVTSAIVGSALGSLDDWRRARGESEPLDAFPPRALVGTFLAESWAGLVARVPAGRPSPSSTSRSPSPRRATGGSNLTAPASATCGPGRNPP